MQTANRVWLDEAVVNGTDKGRKQKVSPSCRKQEVVAKIDDVDWCGFKGMLPLQKYHASAVPAVRSNHRIDEASLSRSSRYLLNQQDSLSPRERKKLQRKILAESRASQPLDPDSHMHVIYRDLDICVVNKPGGILSVPGHRRNPSLANLVHEAFAPHELHVDRMVVHRLDMDTSGVVVYALSESALPKLHRDFRKGNVRKTYEALLCGHMPIAEGDIDLALERDPHCPPFMRVAIPRNGEGQSVWHGDERFRKFMKKAPKPSFTSFRVLSWEYLHECPVTRVSLKPYTGRTHQLRVHCAAMGHPIVGDDIYSFDGEGSENGGLTDELMEHLFPRRCSLDIQQRLRFVQPALCLHAQELCLHHPCTGASMIFKTDTPF